jgi:hypothetical protein
LFFDLNLVAGRLRESRVTQTKSQTGGKYGRGKFE